MTEVLSFIAIITLRFHTFPIYGLIDLVGDKILSVGAVTQFTHFKSSLVSLDV